MESGSSYKELTGLLDVKCRSVKVYNSYILVFCWSTEEDSFRLSALWYLCCNWLCSTGLGDWINEGQGRGGGRNHKEHFWRLFVLRWSILNCGSAHDVVLICVRPVQGFVFLKHLKLEHHVDSTYKLRTCRRQNTVCLRCKHQPVDGVREIIAVYFKNCMQAINVLCGQNCRLFTYWSRWYI